MRIPLLVTVVSLGLSLPLSPDAGAPSRWRAEDSEAASLVDQLDRSGEPERGKILKRILARRLPETVPALSVILAEKELSEIHREYCPHFHCLMESEPWDPVRGEPFHRALCLANTWVTWVGGLKRRGCCHPWNPEAEALRETGVNGKPWEEVLSLLRLKSGGDPYCIPPLHAWSTDSTLRRFPWLGPVVRSLRAEFSPGVIEAKLKAGNQQALFAATVIPDGRRVDWILRALDTGALSRQGGTLRADYVWTLGELGDRRAIPFLLRELKGEEDWSKADAAEALGKMGDPTLLPDLVAALEGASTWTQVHLFEAIARFGGEEEIALLRKYSESRAFTGVVDRARCAQCAIEKIKARLGR